MKEVRLYVTALATSLKSLLKPAEPQCRVVASMEVAHT